MEWSILLVGQCLANVWLMEAQFYQWSWILISEFDEWRVNEWLLVSEWIIDSQLVGQ